MKRFARPLVFALLLAAPFAAAGCARKAHGPDVPKNEPEALEKSKAPVNLLGKRLKGSIASELQESVVLPDGRMAVAVNLRNRTKKIRQVQVRAVFKDARGISGGDETAWQDMFLQPMQQQTWRAESKFPGGELYSVEVRDPKDKF